MQDIGYSGEYQHISRMRLRENLAGYLFAAPWLVGLLVFVLGPILASLYYSFTKYDIFSNPAWRGLSNYEHIFTADELFRKALFNTLYYTIFSVPLAVAGSLLLAVLLNRKLPGISLFRTLFYIPSVTTGVALALLWMLVFDPNMGVFNAIFNHLVGVFNAVFHTRLRFHAPLWYKDEFWAKPFMVLVSLWAIGGTRCVAFLAGLQSMPQTLYEAAEIDGAGWWDKFRRITVPLISPIILYNLIMSMIYSFRVFTNAKVITEGGPMNATLFYVLYLYQVAFRWYKMGYASALAWIFFLLLLVLTLIQLRLSKRWVYYHGG